MMAHPLSFGTICVVLAVIVYLHSSGFRLHPRSEALDINDAAFMKSFADLLLGIERLHPEPDSPFPSTDNLAAECHLHSERRGSQMADGNMRTNRIEAHVQQRFH